MATYGSDFLPEADIKPIIWTSLLFLGVGDLLGGAIEGNQKQQATIDWAIQTTKRCEVVYSREGFASVTDCLKGMVARSESERLEERRSEGYDPRG